MQLTEERFLSEHIDLLEGKSASFHRVFMPLAAALVIGGLT